MIQNFIKALRYTMLLIHSQSDRWIALNKVWTDFITQQLSDILHVVC